MSILAVVLTASIEFNSYISRSAVIRQLITVYQSVKSLSVNVEINYFFIKMFYVFLYSNLSKSQYQ